MSENNVDAGLKILEGELKKAYEKPFVSDEDGTVYRTAMTEEVLQETLVLARPLYEIAHGERTVPEQVTPEGLTELTSTLHELGVIFDSIEVLSRKRPANLPAPLDWLIPGDEAWQDLLRNQEFDTSFNTLVVERLSADSLSGNIGKGLQKTVDEAEEILITFSMRSFDWGDYRWILGSFADHSLCPRAGYEERHAKAALIKKHFHTLLKWHVLGHKPGDGSTLCVLAA